MESSSSHTLLRKETPQLVERWEQKENRFYLYCPQTVLEISVYAPHILRFRFSPEWLFEPDFSYAVVEDASDPTCEYSFKKSGDEFFLTTTKLTCKISKTLRITLEDVEGKLILEDERGFHWQESQDHGGYKVFCSKRIQEKEYFYGLGDKAGSFNLRGKRYENWNSDRYGFENGTDALYKCIPLYYGLHNGQGYGVFFDNTFHSHFDFGHERSDVCTFGAKGGELNYYFIYGPELLRVAGSFTQLTGRPELPPIWSLGYHQSKWSYYPESQLKEVAAKLREYRIPCDALHLDIDYMDGFRSFTWDKKRFPKPARMIRQLKKEGFKTVVIIDPGIKIDPNYKVYREGLEQGYFCQRADGPIMKGDVWPGACYFPDFTRPEVREWWAELFRELVEQGVDGFWNDMNDPAVFELGTFPDDTRHDFDGHPCSHRKAHNVYGMQMARATHKGISELQYPHRPFSLTRAGYAGTQRYAATWTGDNISTWEHLKIANLQCQRLSVSGISFCGSDVGGFIGQPSPELFVRYLQLGAFHPFFRTHSSGDHGDQEPWSFGEENLPIIRKTIELRYQLLPYLYTAFWQYHKEGLPILRPIPFLDQKDPEAPFRTDEFGVGDHLLVCPIEKEGDRGRILYLPRGKWYNYHTDEQLCGGKEVWVEAPIDYIPLFVQAGAVLPHHPVQQYTGEKRLEVVDLHVFYGEGKHSSSLYEDAGDYFGYKQGNYTERHFEQSGGKTRLSLHQSREGRYNSEYYEFRLIFHGLPQPAKKIFLNGRLEPLELPVEMVDELPSLTVEKDFETVRVIWD